AVAITARQEDILAAARAAQRKVAVYGPDEVPFTYGDPAPLARIDRATECALLYTSGTTGKPKGCVLSNDYFLRCGRWYTQIGGLCALRPGEDRLITPLPMTHMNAMACSTLGMVMTGGCIVPLDRFHPR